MATEQDSNFETENYKPKPLNIFEFSKNVGQTTSELIQNELIQKRKTIKIMKRRSKTHTRHIINNMNRNGMDCHGYLNCFVKTTPYKSKYIPNIKCYMNESAKSLFLTDCEESNDASPCVGKTVSKRKPKKLDNCTKIRLKGANKTRAKPQTTKPQTTKPQTTKPQTTKLQTPKLQTPKEPSNRSKSPSTIPLDPRFDNPIISAVLDDLIVKGEFNAEFEDLLCSTFTSSQTL
ncbi:hypothetical protein LOD99_15030 [Oopsacas minuta]|uniref:Uncharacterized protein n=1 Tax=Oopsacas minuta TaxID=111878 RepID=A0AAV7KH03_9METZ|nr:hypothetical protein LOD99_15030 [Oopsacas minuta]